MSLNRHMHPRNLYKDRKPDFKALAVKYDNFRKHATQDLKGKVHLDFKKPESLRALSWALLKEDFNLDVSIPLDRLIPTIPLRLNYILWLEDIVGENREEINGIDIGTGASCIYPLLGAQKNKWNFLTTEVDSFSVGHAKKNVDTNGLQEKIQVVQVAKDSSLYDVLQEDPSAKYDFCMSNPPFFGSNLEAWGLQTTRSDNRSEPSSVSTASPVESIYPGGEVQFVKQMIRDSLQLKDRVRVYTTMLGKKSSLPLLREELRKQSIVNVGTSEFCQGRTMRWGLAWTFDPSVEFPTPPSKLLKSSKPKPPLTYVIPQSLQSDMQVERTVAGISGLVKRLLQELKIELEPEAKTPNEQRWKLTAHTNTWSHQRRKRRHHQAQETNKSEGETTEKHDRSEDRGEHSDKHIRNPAIEEEATGNLGKEIQVENTVERVSSATSEICSDLAQIEDGTSDPTADAFLFKCTLAVKTKEAKGETLVMEMIWLEGENKEFMHQVLQFLKNRIK